MLGISILKNGYGVYSMPVQYRIPVLMAYYGIKNISNEQHIRNNVVYKTNPKEKLLDVVLIVDESVRGDFLDINGENMGITPYLYAHKNRVMNFGYASSGANCSADSNQILRYGVNPNNFENTFNKNP